MQWVHQTRMKSIVNWCVHEARVDHTSWRAVSYIDQHHVEGDEVF
jgi:hypothetical protein